jgi:hypothetical protein
MSEATMRGRVVRALKDVHAIAVENPALPGTPDINYVEGWIELKWLRKWPVNPDTIVRFPEFTGQQRVWHIKRRLAGGVSWVLVQIDQQWLLLDGAIAAMYLDSVTREGLYDGAEAHSDKFNGEELMEWISHQQRPFSLNAEEREKLNQVLHRGTALPPVDTLSGKRKDL